MKFSLRLMSMEVISFEVAIPKLGIFSPGSLAESFEVCEEYRDE